MNNKITKERIIKAAARVFAEKGLENATIDDIAVEAGIAKGSIYNVFKSKEELFKEAQIFSAKERIDVLKALISSLPSAKAKLKMLMYVSKSIAKENPELFLMNYSLLLSTHKNIKSQTASEYFQAYIKFVESIIIEGMDNHEFRVKDSYVLALSLVLSEDLAHILEFINKDVFKTENIDEKLFEELINT